MNRRLPAMGLELPDWPLFGLAADVRPALERARVRGEAAALATIVGLTEGGPRPIGTQMAFFGDAVSGFLSGGCLEADVAGHAAEVLQDGEPRRLVYGEGSPWPDIRLLCGARIEILLERLVPDDEATGVLISLFHERRSALWLSDGVRRACAAIESAPKAWRAAFSRRFDPTLRLIVLGSDPTALAIASLGVQAGFETTLARPKGPAAPPPIAGLAYQRGEPAEALAAVGLDPFTAVAVATHEMETDHAALIAALPSKAFFVGALGARRRVGERVAALERAGVGQEAIARLASPIGLDLGGKAPFEIAVAVIAQILAEAHK
ncbi:MAG: XdhC family protein, partial [Caulobacteraceae bacterium]